MEYLESTGAQYIDTGLILKSNDFHFTLEYAILKTDNRLLQGTNFTWCPSIRNDGYNWLSLPKKDKGRVGGEFTLINERDKRDVLEFKAEEVIKNGIVLDLYGSMPSNHLTIYDTLQVTNVTLKLCSYGDPNQYVHDRFAGKIFNVKLNINDTKTNYIPSISKIGAPCMFDLVTRQPYYNSGTGDDFLYPTPLTTYSLRRPQAEYAKMTERGIQKLYHLPTDYKGTFEDYITQNNFKKIIETECPNEEGKYYGSRWVETDTELIVEWFEIDPPQEEFFEETLDNSQIS